MISLAALRAVIAPVPSRSRVDDLYEHFEPAFWEFAIDTPLREAAFFAQTAYESDRYCALEEYASGDAYDTRVDLGNTPEKDGDGRAYKGRGIIQLTGKTNYRKCSLALLGTEELLAKPEKVATNLALAVRSAGWYWNAKGLNKLADQADFEGLTRRINGGLNGYADRWMFYQRARRVYGI